MDGPTRIKYPRPIYVLGCSPIMAHMQVRQTMIHLKAVQACRSLFIWSHVKRRDT